MIIDGLDFDAFEISQGVYFRFSKCFMHLNQTKQVLHFNLEVFVLICGVFLSQFLLGVPSFD